MAIKTQKLGSIRDLYDTSKAYNSKLSFRIRLTKVITPANNSYAFDKQGGKKMRTQQPSMPLKLMEEVTYTYPSDYKDKDLRGTTQSRIMRHCKNETSIWMDEQRPETEVKHKVTELLITDGYLGGY
jgi:hypothetical protein